MRALVRWVILFFFVLACTVGIVESQTLQRRPGPQLDCQTRINAVRTIYLMAQPEAIGHDRVTIRMQIYVLSKPSVIAMYCTQPDLLADLELQAAWVDYARRLAMLSKMGMEPDGGGWDW